TFRVSNPYTNGTATITNTVGKVGGLTNFYVIGAYGSGSNEANLYVRTNGVDMSLQGAGPVGSSTANVTNVGPMVAGVLAGQSLWSFMLVTNNG
ncbi:hypothetical protein NL321_27770, partial [Klebsiella pneumoniae]|nr:hypothetical protein [Klebsiella pneumoniae]